MQFSFLAVDFGSETERISGTTVLCNIKSVMYHVFCFFLPPFLFKLEINLFNPGGTIDLISSEPMSPVLCASSWGQAQSDLETNTIISRLKYFHCTE